MPVWADALASIDFRKAVQDRWGYWVPEAAMLIQPDNNLRLAGYVANWLEAREPCGGVHGIHHIKAYPR